MPGHAIRFDRCQENRQFGALSASRSALSSDVLPEEVGHRLRALEVARQRARREEAGLNARAGHAVDLLGVVQQPRLARTAVHRHQAHQARQLLGVDALRRDSGQHVLLGEHAVALHVHRGEDALCIVPRRPMRFSAQYGFWCSRCSTEEPTARGATRRRPAAAAPRRTAPARRHCRPGTRGIAVSIALWSDL